MGDGLANYQIHYLPGTLQVVASYASLSGQITTAQAANRGEEALRTFPPEDSLPGVAINNGGIALPASACAGDPLMDHCPRQHQP